MRKKYSKPEIFIEQFLPNEYISACYYGPCNADGYVFHDFNGNGIINEEDTYIYKNMPCSDNGFFIRNVNTKPGTDALVFTEDQITFGTRVTIFGVERYVSGVKSECISSGIPGWHYKNVHTSTELSLQQRPNHS